jgi:antitoxin MazE
MFVKFACIAADPYVYHLDTQEVFAMPMKSRRAAKVIRSGKVARWGNSLAFRIPQDIVEKLSLTEGGKVSMELSSDSFTVRPMRKKWTEAELLRGVTPDMVGGEVDWGGPVGKEVL